MYGIVFWALACTANEGKTDVQNADQNTEQAEKQVAKWTFLLFLNADNDLESYVSHDLNELEQAGSDENIHIVVQADRSEEFWEGDGNWTEGRRYYITADDDDEKVSSEVVENLGEVDMGIPETLSDFLLWADDNYPAEHMALIFWNHGESWSKNGFVPPFISWDQGSGNALSFAEGDVHQALAALVERRGPLDVVGFDACYMASWEVGHSLQEQARVMLGSQAIVGMPGYHYPTALQSLKENPDLSPQEFADKMAYSAAEVNGEWSHSVSNLESLDGLNTAIDQLALVILENPDLEGGFLLAREQAIAADDTWHDYFLDLGSLAVALTQSEESSLVLAGEEIIQELEKVILFNYTNEPYTDLTGFTIYADTTLDYLEPYSQGTGSTWSHDTHWDEMLLQLALRE